MRILPRVRNRVSRCPSSRASGPFQPSLPTLGIQTLRPSCRKLIKLSGLVVCRIRDPPNTLFCIHSMIGLFPKAFSSRNIWNQKTRFPGLDLPPSATWPSADPVHLGQKLKMKSVKSDLQSFQVRKFEKIPNNLYFSKVVLSTQNRKTVNKMKR